MQAGRRDDSSSNIGNSTFDVGADLGRVRLQQSLTGGSVLNVAGREKYIDIDKSIME